MVKIGDFEGKLQSANPKKGKEDLIIQMRKSKGLIKQCKEYICIY